MTSREMEYRVGHSRMLRLVRLKYEQEALFIRCNKCAKAGYLLQSVMFIYVTELERSNE